MSDTREVKRIYFTRSTDVVVPGQRDQFDTEPDTFEQEPTEDWADVIRRPSGLEIRKYVQLVERVSGTRSRYEVATGLVQMFTVDWSLTDGSGARLAFDEKGQDQVDGEYLKQLAEAIWVIVGPRVPKL